MGDIVDLAIAAVAPHASVIQVELGGSRSRGTNDELWAWVWWLATKASVGRNVEDHWPRLYRHMLEPMGATTVPNSIEAAVRTFLLRRSELEREYGVELSRPLETEVRSGIRRLGYKA